MKTKIILAVLLTACGPEAIVLGEGETSSETGETGGGDTDTGGETSTGGETETGGETDVDHDPPEGDGDPVGDGRLRLIEFKCVADVCQGRWDGTDRWSLVSDAADVAASVEIHPPWACSPAPDVDVCVDVDLQGHVGCFWYQDGWAVAVAPSCAGSGVQWLDVGNEMRAKAT